MSHLNRQAPPHDFIQHTQCQKPLLLEGVAHEIHGTPRSRAGRPPAVDGGVIVPEYYIVGPTQIGGDYETFRRNSIMR